MTFSIFKTQPYPLSLANHLSSVIFRVLLNHGLLLRSILLSEPLPVLMCVFLQYFQAYVI